MNRKFFVAALALCVCAFLITGCPKSGPKKVKISGTVTVDGEPAGVGSIMFKEEGKPSEGAVLKDGKFECEIQTGTKKVVVEAARVVGTFEPDPLLMPGVTADKTEAYPDGTFLEEKEITVTKKGETFNIEYGSDEE